MIDLIGLWVLLALSLNMWALLSVLGSGARWTVKLFWVVPLLFLPGLGFLGWYLLGPRSSRA